MSFREKNEKLHELLRQIEKLAPTNKDGELEQPFQTWAKNLGRELEKAEKWDQDLAAEPDRKGAGFGDSDAEAG